MLKLFCDRCRKEIDRTKEIYFSVTMNDYKKNINNQEYWEICQECAFFFRFWMGATKDNHSIKFDEKEQKSN